MVGCEIQQPRSPMMDMPQPQKPPRFNEARVASINVGHEIWPNLASYAFVSPLQYLPEQALNTTKRDALYVSGRGRRNHWCLNRMRKSKSLRSGSRQFRELLARQTRHAIDEAKITRLRPAPIRWELGSVVRKKIKFASSWLTADGTAAPDNTKFLSHFHFERTHHPVAQRNPYAVILPIQGVWDVAD